MISWWSCHFDNPITPKYSLEVARTAHADRGPLGPAGLGTSINFCTAAKYATPRGRIALG